MNLQEALILQGNSITETKDIINSMKEDILNGADPEMILEEFGLEPDYVLDLLEMYF